MLVLGFLLFFGAGVSGEPKLISNYVVRIENDVLLNVESTPTSTGELDLSNKNLLKIEDNCFDGLTGLKSLDLSGNHFHSRLPYLVFSFLGDLERLSLENCKIRKLDWIFWGLSKLRFLDLRRNNFGALTLGCFHGLSNTTKIQLSDDAGSSIDQTHFLEPYPLLVLCKTNGIVRSLKVFGESSDDEDSDYEGGNDEGSDEEDSNNEDSNDEDSDVNAKCPLMYVPAINWTVDLSSEDIEGFEPYWWNVWDRNMQVLKLGRNNIKNLTSVLFNDLPRKLWNVDLSWNYITSIENGIIYNRSLRKLNFVGNPIVKIEPYAFEGTTLEDLEIPFPFIESLPKSLRTLTLGGDGNFKFRCTNSKIIP